MSRGISQAGRNHIPSHLRDWVKTWNQLSWNLKNLKSSGRRLVSGYPGLIGAFLFIKGDKSKRKTVREIGVTPVSPPDIKRPLLAHKHNEPSMHTYRKRIAEGTGPRVRISDAEEGVLRHEFSQEA